MSTVNGQSVAVSGQRTERSMWAGPTLIFFFHVEHGLLACGLWTTLADYGACLWAGPTLFFFSLTVIMFVFTLRTKNFVASVLF